jgi:hypothetical protein
MALACSGSPAGGPPHPSQGCAIEDVVADGGSCIAPGVPPDGCSSGFTYDGNGGCTPILPATDCGEGEMAVPGETECHAVGAAGEPPTCPAGQLAIPGESACHDLADCGSGTWGAIPVDATTQYVDASYAGGASDGSAGKPWTSIGAAVNAAAPGAIVAVAAGSYHENVAIQYRPVKLWGRCPSRVEIVASRGGATAAVTVFEAAGTELHQVALTGDGIGAELDSDGVLVDAVWVHDTTEYAVEATGTPSVRRSLLERSSAEGLFVSAGAHVTIDASVIRDVAPNAAGNLGHGVEANGSSSITVTGSLLERNHDMQIGLFGSDGVVDGCVIRDARPRQVDRGTGIGIDAFVESGHVPQLTVRSTTLERNLTSAIAGLTAEILVDYTLIRDTLPTASDGSLGYAIYATADSTTKQASKVTARDVLVERARAVALPAQGCSLEVDRSVVRDTLPQQSDGKYGSAVVVQPDPTTGVGSSLAMRGSLLERNQWVCLAIRGAGATVDATVVRGTTPGPNVVGHGIEVIVEGSTPGTLTLVGSVVTGNTELGLGVLGSDLSLDRTVVSSTIPSTTAPAGDAVGGYAVQVVSDPAHRPALAMTRSLLADSVGLALFVGGADATISQTWLRGVASLPDGAFGDGLSAFGDATVTASNVRIEQSARAGLSMFDSAQVQLASAALECDSISLDGEGQSTFAAAGPLRCDCNGAAASCQVLSSSLEPPAAIGGASAP